MSITITEQTIEGPIEHEIKKGDRVKAFHPYSFGVTREAIVKQIKGDIVSLEFLHFTGPRGRKNYKLHKDNVCRLIHSY